MNAKCSILSLALLAAWLSAAGTEPTNVVVHWQSTSPSGASRIATAAYYDGLGRHVASVAEDASPDGGDIVEIKEYDAAGIITIKFGHIEGSGEFVNGTITYSENLGEATYIEELIHAFQYVFGQMDDPSINKEYEARLLTMWVLGEVKTLAPSVEGCLGKYLDQIYSGRLVGIGNPELLRTEYQEYGKMFVDHFKRTYPTDTNYHVPANEPSRLFISIFQFLFNKILKTCRY